MMNELDEFYPYAEISSVTAAGPSSFSKSFEGGDCKIILMSRYTADVTKSGAIHQHGSKKNTLSDNWNISNHPYMTNDEKRKGVCYI
jgi:hypothetical protein